MAINFKDVYRLTRRAVRSDGEVIDDPPLIAAGVRKLRDPSSGVPRYDGRINAMSRDGFSVYGRLVKDTPGGGVVENMKAAEGEHHYLIFEYLTREMMAQMTTITGLSVLLSDLGDTPEVQNFFHAMLVDEFWIEDPDSPLPTAA